MPAAARARRASRRGRLLGRRPRVLRTAAGREGDDVFFYGYGDKFRREWMAAMVGEPSRRRRRSSSRSAAATSAATSAAPARSATCPSTSSRGRSRPRESTSTSPGARTPACRLLDVPAVRARGCRRGDRLEPHEGIERWFEPGQELLVVKDADEAVAAYRALLDDPGAGRGDGRPCPRARPRRAHVRPSRPPAARLVGLEPGGRACLSTAASRSSQPGTRGRDRRRGRRSCAPSTPSSTCVVSTTAPRTRRPRRGRRTAPRSSGCPSTSASAAPSRQASSTRSSTATTRCPARRRRQHDPQEIRSCSRRSHAAKRTSSSAPASPTADGDYRPPFARRAGIRWFAGSSRC